jgi:hypothetical protein
MVEEDQRYTVAAAVEEKIRGVCILDGGRVRIGKVVSFNLDFSTGFLNFLFTSEERENIFKLERGGVHVCMRPCVPRM